MRIVFLVPYPLKKSPSQRFRFEQYFPQLDSNSIQFEVHPFLSNKGWNVIYEKGMFFQKLFFFITGYLKRFVHLFAALKGDFIFVHREITPLGPPVFEWLLARLFRKRLIYDFDDAIWLPDINHKKGSLEFFKFRNKINSIIKWSYKISCGNRFLCNYASVYNESVVLNPTTIDTANLHNPDLFPPKKESEDIVIGWTGTHSTLPYLKKVESSVQRILDTFQNVRFCVIANKKPTLALNRVEFRQWNERTEIDDLIRFDIGIMPLTDDQWSKGKCGFKALQYMALKIPAIASPVGVNPSIIEHGVNGFLATAPEEWYEHLSALVTDRDLRKRIGAAGRETVINNYSVASNTATFLALFK